MRQGESWAINLTEGAAMALLAKGQKKGVAGGNTCFNSLSGTNRNSTLVVAFVGNRQSGASAGAASGQNATAVCRRHALAKAVFVATLAVRGLECPFHNLIGLGRCVLFTLVSRLSPSKTGCKYN
jgi:hypothetical protein